MKYYLQALSKYADFKGRARRKEYWMYTLFNVLVFIVCIIFDLVLIFIIDVPVFYMAYVLISIVPSLAVSVRRLHDIGKSGWFLLWFLLCYLLLSFFGPLGAIAASIIVHVYYCREGQKTTNEWGEDPKTVEEKPLNKKTLKILLYVFLGLSLIFFLLFQI